MGRRDTIEWVEDHDGVEWLKGEIVDEGEHFIDIDLGEMTYQTIDGHFIIEKDFKTKNDIWRVHKTDADPYPSNPHAHCISGQHNGMKLHLGNRKLYKQSKEVGKLLPQKAFNRLISMISTKFPNIDFPLPPD